MVEETLASGEAAETKKLGGNASFRGGGGNKKNKKETLASGEAAETKKNVENRFLELPRPRAGS